MFFSCIGVFVVFAATAFIQASPLPQNVTFPRQLLGQGLAQVISSCTVPNTVALTFDDGPYLYMHDIVNTLDAAGAKGTFFVNGDNYRCIYTAESISRVQYAYRHGHQIASHTWSHKDLATLPPNQVLDEMRRLDEALGRIIGVAPSFMRPPYGSYNDGVRTAAASRGQAVVMWDFDSGDSTGSSPEQSNQAYSNLAAQHPSTVLTLNHEVYEPSAHIVLPHAIQVFKERGYRLVTVAECLGSTAYHPVVSPPLDPDHC